MSANQVDVVKYTIKVGSKTLCEDVPIHSILVDKHVNKVPYAKIVIYDGDVALQSFDIADNKTFVIGAKVIIEAGYGNALEKIFEGVVVKLAIKSRQESFSTLVVTCKDIAFQTTIATKTMHFEKSKDSDVIKKILGGYNGIKNKVEPTAVVHESLVQYEVSDWDFLNIRAEANGKIIVVNDGEVSIKMPKVNGKGALTYTYGEDFIHFDAEIDVQDQWAGVAACSWDSSKQQVVSKKVSDPGERSMGDISYKKLVSATQKAIVPVAHGGVLNEEIKTLATSLLDRRRIAKIKGNMTVVGNAKLKHDSLISIKKGSNHFSGDAYVSGIRHFISDGVWDTELTLGLDAQRYMRKYNDICNLPAAGMVPPVYGLQLGIVKKITQDPQNNHRILVNFPLIQEKSKEGVWCRLSSFYATQKSGAFFIPEVEDEVVVGFVNDDIRSPIILGSLYSGKHEPPKTGNDKNLYKSFVSKEKLELTFHDNEKGPEIIIKTPKGGSIQISDKEKSIKIVDQNNNKITLSSSGISLTSDKDITLDAKGKLNIKSLKDVVVNGTQNLNLKSMNINAQASMKASISGNASAEVKSNMATIIKGTTVLIN